MLNRLLILFDGLLAIGLGSFAYVMAPIAYGMGCDTPVPQRCEPMGHVVRLSLALAPVFVVLLLACAAFRLQRRYPSLSRFMLLSFPLALFAWCGMVWLSSRL